MTGSMMDGHEVFAYAAPLDGALPSASALISEMFFVFSLRGDISDGEPDVLSLGRRRSKLIRRR